VIAHAGGLPIEEIAWPVLSGSGIGLLLARAWFYDFRHGSSRTADARRRRR
jgi:hypothetical protein